MVDVSFWFFAGTFNLLFLTYQDFKHKMMVDDRANKFMLGLSVALFYFFGRNIYYLIAVFVFALLSNFLVQKFSLFGEGDTNALLWIYIGAGLVNSLYVLWFFLVFISITGVYVLIKRILGVHKKKTPFFIVILLSYVVFGIIVNGF